MNFGDFLEILHINSITSDIRVVIVVTDLICSDNIIYDHIGIQDDFITRTMMKYRVDCVDVSKDMLIIGLHNDCA